MTRSPHAPPSIGREVPRFQADDAEKPKEEGETPEKTKATYADAQQSAANARQPPADASQPPFEAQRRPVLWPLVLVALTLIIFGVVKFWPSTTTDELTSSEPSAKPESNELVFDPADRTTVRAPGSLQQSYVAPLADAYRRIDPGADGWQTEAFHEASNKQLKLLADSFKKELDDATLNAIADDELWCPPLQPSSTDIVFQDDTLLVERGKSFQQVAGTNEQSRGAAALRSAIEQFRKQFTDSTIDHVKFKPFRVLPGDDSRARTTLYFQASGKHESGTRQVNAQWDVEWKTDSGKSPRILSIQLSDFETIFYRGNQERLFSDCTESVLGETSAYGRQMLRSTDYWRARLPRDLGLDPVANHGIAIGDVNGDDLEDVYVCQQGGLPNRLFIQNADGTLRDESAASGTDWLDYCASALLVDFDNDGDRDLAIAQEWRILLMSNDGSGHFQLEFGTSSEAQSFSLAASDFDLDGDVDVFACGYNPPASTMRRGVMGEPMPYHDANNGGKNMLLRNDGNWLFTDATEPSGLNQNNTRFSFAAAWEDFDNDGDPDLYVANDYGRNNLYRNDDGRFVDIAADYDVEDMSAGMSASWADVNRDGRMDLYVSNMFSAAGNRITYQRQFKSNVDSSVREQFQRHARGNSLFLNDGDGFRDASEQSRITMGRWAWGSRFVDLNGDGWEDLIVANGFISAEDTGDL